MRDYGKMGEMNVAVPAKPKAVAHILVNNTARLSAILERLTALTTDVAPQSDNARMAPEGTPNGSSHLKVIELSVLRQEDLLTGIESRVMDLVSRLTGVEQ